MTSTELKHRAKLQEWSARIQDCRSSGLSVRAWCRQEGITAATYCRWEREILTAAGAMPCLSASAVLAVWKKSPAFAEQILFMWGAQFALAICVQVANRKEQYWS